MTKKHFIQLAKALRIAFNAADQLEDKKSVGIVTQLVIDICDICQETNPRFNRNKFVEASTGNYA